MSGVEVEGERGVDLSRARAHETESKRESTLEHTVINGSNLIEMSLHFGHVSVDLNCPWKVSTITESFLILCPSHDSAAAFASSIPLPSTAGTSGWS
jgi:hypothetical protein